MSPWLVKSPLRIVRNLFSRSSGRRRRFGIPVKIVGLILVAVLIPSLLISALGLYAVYRAEALVREQVEAPIRRRLDLLLHSASDEWNARHARYAERLNIEPDLHRYLDSLTRMDPHILDTLIVRSDGVVEPLRVESPLWHLEPPRPGSELSRAWQAEFVEKDLALAGSIYRRLATEASPEIAAEALAGLARVEVARDKPREAILHLKRLADRFGYTVDDSGIPRGLAALLRITELYRDVGDLVNEGVHQGETRDFLRSVEPWLEAGTAEFFWSRLEDLASKAGRSPEESEDNAQDPDPPGVSLRRSPVVEEVTAHALALLPDAPSIGYVPLDGSENWNLAYFRHETGGHTVYLALNPEEYLKDVRRFYGPLDVGKKRLRFADEETGQFALNHDEPPAVRPISMVLPPPFEGSFSMRYYPFPQEIPESLERLETLKTPAFAWAIVVLGLTGLLGILVTVRSILEEMQVARLKSDFVSFVTHELKTPLAGIRTLTETLLMGRGGDRDGELKCIRLIDKEATRLSRFIGSVLEFSKLEKYQHSFAFTSCDMVEVVDEAVSLFKEHTPDSDYEIEIHRAQHISRIRMDRAAILEAILNLVSNAYKYSRGDSRKIVINLRESIDHISVDVIDNGVGIAKRDQRKIFERFYRAEDFLTRDVDGSGLGLSFARYIAKVHDGEIRVQSTPEQGSRFTLELRKNQVLAE